MALPYIDQLTAAVKTRDRFFLKIQNAHDLITDDAKKDEFLIRAAQAEDAQQRFEKQLDLIIKLNTQVEADEEVDCSQNSTAFDALYYEVKARESALKASANPAALPQPVEPPPTKIKLPTINVPMFNGDVTTFPSFKSLYDQLIHRNSSLSDIQKFSYLKGYLSPTAASCIDHISFVPQNYPLAYKSVGDRYGNSRVLANAYLAQILKFHSLQTDQVRGLRNFLDVFHVNVESLKGLNINNLGEFILLQLGLKALDDKTRLEFEHDQKAGSMPKYPDLVKFVQHKCSVLDMAQDNASNKVVFANRKSLVTTNHHDHGNSSGRPPFNPSNIPDRRSSVFKCSVCNGAGHRIASCAKFLNLDPSHRIKKVKELKLCLACLSSTHFLPDCKSTYQCKQCRSTSHHSLLHDLDRPSKSTPNHSTALQATQSSYHTTNQVNISSSVVLLGTAIVQLQDKYGLWHPVRCILDSGSQISIMTQRLAHQLKLPWRASSLQVSGVGSDNPIRSKGEVNVNLLPHQHVVKPGMKPFDIQAIILPKIANNLASPVNSEIVHNFTHLPLADLTYVNSNFNRSIELLIGAEYYCQLLDNTTRIIVGNPSAVPSVLGWLLVGKCPTSSDQNQLHQSFFVTEDPLVSQLQKFWEIEELPQLRPQNPEEVECEKHFVDTHQRDESGKYVLRLPFKNLTPPDLGTNRDIALRRLASLDKKLSLNPEYKTLYEENLESYLEPGHMTLATNPSPYLLVHHGVYRATSSTTKLRVVFDPNIPGCSGGSLASSMLVGPKLQKEISNLLIHFRLNPVAITCDIQAMYRSILIHPEDRKFQHILWHAKGSKSITEYELTTCTFGLPPSPYQAQRVLQQLALDEGSAFPQAADVLTNDVYVDDIVTGAQTVQDAIELRNDLFSILEKGGFAVRKWASSHSAVLSDIPESLCEKPYSFSEGGEESIKILGLKWNPGTDSFFWEVNPPSLSSTITKRQVLSFVAAIYDCNGYLSPIIVWMKIFLQHLWLDSSLSWDTPLSENLHEKWVSFTSELSVVSKIQIPRHIILEGLESIHLVGFADASKAAYAAVVYLRTCDWHGQVKTYLLRAKTKVSPLKVLTINRLELCAALLLSKTIKSLAFLSNKLSINQIHLFSDSCVVLSWLKTPPHQLKTFVANRVIQILEITKPAQWRHVTTERNSADPASRGLSPTLLVTNGLWFKGPAFLKQPIEDWPLSSIDVPDQVPELKPTISLVTSADINPLIQTVERYSSLGKLQRVFAYVLRFIDGCRKRRSAVVSLSLVELDCALKAVIRITQASYLQEDLKSVKSGQPVGNNLCSLSPILNSAGILAVGGRLTNAPIPESAKHPTLIPQKCHLATLLVWHFHALTLHGGPKVVQSLLQQQYWIIGGRNLIRHQLSKCVKCIKTKPVFHQPMMADLPASRFAQGRAFLNVGVDLAGPFSLKSGPRRNSPIVKAYFAIFICMSVKAIHLELLSSLSTPCFLAALDRFIGRRGLPSAIYSDNGTNFQGAARHLSETHQFLSTYQDQISSHLLTREVSWIFNPPSAPNFGGLWEAGVKSVKKHLKHVLHDHSFNYEEFLTILISCESICNSRPLCALGVNPNDGVDVLTPGHFLTGAPLLARAETDVSETYIPPVKRWLLITQANQSFWKRWKADYLNTLIQRGKWTSGSENVKVGDVVIIRGDDSPPQQWPLGRVTEVLPGPDGVVRVTKVRTSRGELTRPAAKLAVLPMGESHDCK
uniref:Endonuclease n=1 Tax=Cacopsylla melanoneura TaxID=428564 RepID=A0A8D8UZ49_9HEMI